METRLYVFLLSIAPLMAAPAAAAEQDEDLDLPPRIVEPDLDRRRIKPPRIDTENVELGVYGGVMSVEDFGSNTVTGLRLAYHITEGLFVEAAYGMTDTDPTSFEELSGGAPLLTEDEREYTYYNLSFGYNFLPGEVFIGKRRAFSASLYLIGGAGSTEFASDSRFTINFGVGTRVLFTDWLALHLDVRDHLFDTDLLGEEKTTHNIEYHMSLTAFF